MSKETISIIGSGVVGQATGKGFMAHGYQVQFIDINSETVSKLKQEGFAAFTPEELEKEGDSSDITVFTVSTPTHDGQINLNYLKAAAKDLGKRMAKMVKYHLVVVRSTVVPGTTEELIMPIIAEQSGKVAGKDYGICMNPEYLREVSAEEDFAKPWIITIGELDKRSGDMLAKVYEKYTCPKYRVSPREAEMQKYIHNIFNAHKIAYFNEMRDICNRAGIDADKIFPIVAQSAEGMWNPQYGIRDFGPFDGMCLPKDTQAMLAWAHDLSWEMPILETVIATNNQLLASKNKTEKTVPQEQLAAQPAAA